jgi:hypothetical protein
MADSLITLFQPKTSAEEQEALLRENAARTAARMSPTEYATYLSARGGQGLGRGIVQTGAAAFGYDARTPGQQEDDSIAAAKAEVQRLGFDPEKPESIDQFYRQVIGILQRRGLVAQAMQVAKEYQTQKAANTRADAQVRTADARAGELEARLLAAMPNLGRYLTMLEAAQKQLDADPENPGLQNKVRVLSMAIERDTKGKVTVHNANDRLLVLDSDGNEVRSFPKGIPPKAPGSGSAKGSDGGYKTAKERIFYRIRELEALVESGEATDKDRRELQAWYDQEAGKEKPPTEKELSGEAALGQLQYVQERFKPKYASQMRGFLPEEAINLLERAEGALGNNTDTNQWWAAYGDWYNRMLNALSGAAVTKPEALRFQSVGVNRAMRPEVIEARLKQQIEIANLGLAKMKAARQPNRKIVPAAAPKVPGQPVAPQPADMVRVQAPNGTTGSIPRDKLDAALKRGYKEIK